MTYALDVLSNEDYDMATEMLKGTPSPDLVIAPDGKPYLYRWHIVPHNKKGNVYFHLQVSSDPERPLHDHPWDNHSVILAGGYEEIIADAFDDKTGKPTYVTRHMRRPGDSIWRPAKQSHRLLLPKSIPYTLTLFSTGPKVKNWGFWYPDGWKDADDVTRLVDGKSVHVKSKE